MTNKPQLTKMLWLQEMDFLILLLAFPQQAR